MVVLYGGRSAEHEISCISAGHVVRALAAAGHRVVPVGITRTGEWVDARALVASLDPSATALPSPDLAAPGDRAALERLLAGPEADRTVVFPLLHGPMGEDGTVQGLLELLRVPYVGAGVLASSLCMDKSAAKEVLAHHGIAQARWVTLHAGSADLDDPATAAAPLGFPLYVKPANLGSSIGISRAHDVSQLREAVALAASFDDVVVVEEQVDGRELEVAVLGNQEPSASVPGEIVADGGFYSFDEKYVHDRTKLLIPAPVEPAVAAEAQALACRTYRALRVEGMARVDLFLEPGGRLLVNEVNTIPGFTPISMYPRLWQATGLPTPTLLGRLVDLALERHTRRDGRRLTR